MRVLLGRRRFIESVGREESLFEEGKALNHTSFFGREAEAFWCDLDFGFGCKGYAAQQEVELAGGGREGGEQGRVWRVHPRAQGGV